MKSKTFLDVTAVVFGLVAVLHLVRLVLSWPAQIAGWQIPLWLSLVGFVVATYLSATAIRLAKKVK